MANVIVGRKSGFIQRAGAMRRQTLWLSSATVTNVLAGAGSATILTTLNAAALALRPFTVVRNRGSYFIRSDQTGALEFYDWSYGQIVVTDQASAAGIASVPTPATDDSSDWPTYVRRMGAFLFVTGAGFDSSPGGISGTFDSKAMRKVDLGEDLIEIHEVSLVSLGISGSVYARTLIKLH